MHDRINQRMLDRSRELLADRQEDEALAAQQNKEWLMTQYKTSYGDRVDKPTPTKPVRQQMDDLYESAAEALDVVGEAARRAATIAQTDTVDARRFPNAVRGER